jgi:hypothetical protein
MYSGKIAVPPGGGGIQNNNNNGNKCATGIARPLVIIYLLEEVFYIINPKVITYSTRRHGNFAEVPTYTITDITIK